MLAQKWQQSWPSTALPLFPNRKPVEAQSAGLFQACKWISPIPPRFVKWGSMGLLLFFSASLSPHSSVMSTVKWRREPGPGKKTQRGNNCYYDLAACLLSTGLQLFQWAWTRTHMKKGKAVNITYPPTGRNETAAADRELLKILSSVWNLSLSVPELSLRWCTVHCVLSFLVRWFNM